MPRYAKKIQEKPLTNKGRIVVVDDEENIRSAIKDILSDEGYEVDCASDGETALRLIQSSAPDLVLLDIWMPGLDGLQTLKILKNMESEVEVVMMSGHGAIETAVKATKIGAFDFIEKPFSLDSILRAVGKALRSKRLRAKKNRLALRQSAMVDRFTGSSHNASETRRLIRETAQGTSPALLVGEPGLGKRFAARLIHAMSPMGDRPFAEVVCETLSETDIEGLERGLDLDKEPSGGETREGQAPPGAILFEKINNSRPEVSSRLVDLINSLARGFGAAPPPRIMATFEISAGSPPAGPVYEALVAAGAVTIELAPLRERKGDIHELVEKLIDDFSDEYSKNVESVENKAMERFVSMPWPGNARELKETVSRAVSLCEGPVLTADMARRAIEGEGAPLAFPSQTGIRVYGHGSIIPPRPGSGKQKAKERQGMLRQRTLKNSVVLRGLGLHSGIKTGMILSPLPPDSGIVFGDISTGLRVPALLENVRSTEYATTLSNGRVTIKTIEHIMSALHSYRITNLLIKIGDEAPIMDGSALDFCQIIEDSGIDDQDGFIEEITVEEPISVGEEETGPFIRVEPAPVFSVHYYLDYPAPIGVQEYEYVHQSGEHYKETIAPARTFGFLRDMKKMEAAGLAGGGKLSNVVLIGDDKVINTPLRFPDEPARHKILDLLGDLYLLGRPIRARITARKSGHTQNIALIKKINERLTSQHVLK